MDNFEKKMCMGLWIIVAVGLLSIQNLPPTGWPFVVTALSCQHYLCGNIASVPNTTFVSALSLFQNRMLCGNTDLEPILPFFFTAGATRDAFPCVPRLWIDGLT